MPQTSNPLDESYSETWDSENLLRLREKELDLAHAEIKELTETVAMLLEIMGRVQLPNIEAWTLVNALRADSTLAGRLK
jgi:hypothetical protein